MFSLIDYFHPLGGRRRAAAEADAEESEGLLRGAVETETQSSRSKPKRLRNNRLGPAWVWALEDRSNTETKVWPISLY